MNAMKCDRCGALFERKILTDVIIAKRHGIGWFDVDLCNKCQAELENWLKASEIKP